MPVDTDIAKIIARNDPMLSFKWVCPDETLPFGLPSNFLESVDVPWMNIRVAEGVHAGSSYDYFPGPHDISAFSMSFYEDDTARCMKWIQFWKSQVKDFKTGLYKLPKDYKKDINVQLVDTKNSPIMTIKLEGCWPEATSNWALNYTDNGRLTVTQNFSIDSQEIVFHK